MQTNDVQIFEGDSVAFLISVYRNSGFQPDRALALSSFDSCVSPVQITWSGDVILDFTDRSLEIGSCLIISDLDDQLEVLGGTRR